MDEFPSSEDFVQEEVSMMEDVFGEDGGDTGEELTTLENSLMSLITTAMDWEHAGTLSIAFGILVLSLCVIPLVQSTYSTSPLVARKTLPRRPVLNIHFKPEDDTQHHQQESSTHVAESNGDKNGTTTEPGRWKRRISSFHEEVKSMTRHLFSRKNKSARTNSNDAHDDDLMSDEEGEIVRDDPYSDEDKLLDSDEEEEEEKLRKSGVSEPTFVLDTDLPDSFAPLLSSSHVEIANSNLTADLIHSVQAKVTARLRVGRHEIPLNKDESRPQFILEVPEGGCQISVSSLVGSDGFTLDQDLDPSIPTLDRTKALVKQACVTLDPPLPLANVAPTLIHFPSLFVDKMVVRLRRIYVFRFVINFIVSISAYVERCLWLVESKCQIHLSRAQMVPVYKGIAGSTPKWHLCPAFSGHVLVFGWIPIPFISVVLPSFIIPHPHALLDSLLSKQPFASAKLKRENIAEERIAIAALEPVEKWTAQLTLLGTPPAVGVDITLPGGLSVALEMALGRDPAAQSKCVFSSSTARTTAATVKTSPNVDNDEAKSAPPARGLIRTNSLSSWSTNQQQSSRTFSSVKYDANKQEPWSISFKAKGTCSREKLTFMLLDLSLNQNANITPTSPGTTSGGGSTKQVLQASTPRQDSSRFSANGSFAIWKMDPAKAAARAADPTSIPLHKTSSWGRVQRRAGSLGASHPVLDAADSPSVAAILLFPDETKSFHHYLRMLQYDYALVVAEDCKLDALTLSVGATHPMLKGGTTITTILETIFAYGTMTARDDAILDPVERRRKRNILHHLPAVDFSCGVQNVYIPPESGSYSDDGQTLFSPELTGGRIMVRFLGGIDEKGADEVDAVSEGVMIVGNFEVASFNLKTEGAVKEFPELEVYEGTKLLTNLSGSMNGKVKSHLRPQTVTSRIVSAGPNIFNPLEAYEIDFSGTDLSVKMREYAAVLGHRRVILPAESVFIISVIESVVDMGFEGKTLCELGWDFQGLSPILQVVPPGESPENALPERKEQVSLLIGPLRQGRISMQISSVGGIKVKKAATSRDHREGLYDWKFFNALVSPDESSAQRILDVIHDRRTMKKLLQVVKLINEELHNIMEYSLEQVWRAKKILDAEGVSDPGHVIPMYKMSRLLSLFLTGDVHEVSVVLSIVRRVVEGEGLDAVRVKELLRRHVPRYEDWAPEIDRGLRLAAVLMGAWVVSPNVAGQGIIPLAEVPHHAEKFKDIPTAQQLYSTVLEKPHLPLDPVFSNLVSRVAPYLSLRQIEFLLETRPPVDWQQTDLRRLRYVYSIKKKVTEIAESYGGFSFLPQSFLVSVFLGEATKSSMRLSKARARRKKLFDSMSASGSRKSFRLKKRRNLGSFDEEYYLSPAQCATLTSKDQSALDEEEIVLEYETSIDGLPGVEAYELGDSLLGPQDVAILLQSGLTSMMKSSTVVQLNQRMLLDLICSQPHSFAVAVLAEIGSPSGEGSPRSLTGALMSMLELDQTAFTDRSKIDMHALLESWLPGLKVPRREDYMAGGRWARQSYYEAIFSVATSILEDAEAYMALKGHLQRVRHQKESDPIPGPIGSPDLVEIKDSLRSEDGHTGKYQIALAEAQEKIAAADKRGYLLIDSLISDTERVKLTDDYQRTIDSYCEAFASCAALLKLDRYAFQLRFFRDFYRRNYEALMIKSMYDNVVEDVDEVRHWLQALRNGSMGVTRIDGNEQQIYGSKSIDSSMRLADSFTSSEGEWEALEDPVPGDGLFMAPEGRGEQVLVDAIIEATIYNESDRKRLSRDPLVRLLIPNPEGVHYDFAIVTAMGVITEGERGLELKDAFERLKQKRGVILVRSATGTARSLEYNAGKIEQAIELLAQMKKPFGLLGYSQGCPNALMAETIMNSGSPNQQSKLQGLVCRQLLFSASNGSVHGPSIEGKVQRLIILCEEFFKYQQGYVSRALSSTVLGVVTNILDSADFHKFMGGVQIFLRDGCRAFWREAQHLPHVPTCTLRGVLEPHTTPESLEMLAHLSTKQSGSNLHDSQVHAFDAVGHPIYHRNRNGRILERCDIGEASIQRTHHWSPLSDEVEFVRTKKDIEQGSFECAKDRHIFPWVEVNARFGFIKPLHRQIATIDSNEEEEIRSKLGL